MLSNICYSLIVCRLTHRWQWLRMIANCNHDQKKRKRKNNQMLLSMEIDPSSSQRVGQGVRLELYIYLMTMNTFWYAFRRFQALVLLNGLQIFLGRCLACLQILKHLVGREIASWVLPESTAPDKMMLILGFHQAASLFIVTPGHGFTYTMDHFVEKYLFSSLQLTVQLIKVHR